MDIDDAISLLERHASADDPWRAHSLQVSAAARRLAELLTRRGHTVDVGRATVLGLLHDLGRSRGHGLRHGIEGYLLARDEGYADEGRICLIHILKGHSLEQGVGLGMLTEQERDELLRSGCEFGRLSLEEKVVCVADAMTSDPGLVSIGEKYTNVRRRYGSFPHHDDNEAWAEEAAAELTELLGETPYDALKRHSDALL